MFLVFPLLGSIFGLIGMAIYKDFSRGIHRVLDDEADGVEVEVSFADSEERARLIADHMSADIEMHAEKESRKVFVIRNEDGAISDAADYCDAFNRNEAAATFRCIVI